MRVILGCTALLLCCTLIPSVIAQGCTLPENPKKKDFPDLFKEGQLSYELSVELTTSNNQIKETAFIKEYCDYENKQGRVDVEAKGKKSSFYYYKDTDEIFNVKGESCESVTMSKGIPEYNKVAVTDWTYGDVRGPSAMFLNALDVSKTAKDRIAYMGESEEGDYIRGLKYQYWRRCKGDQTVDYYFTVDSHDDAFGFEKLKQIPLKVAFGNSSIDSRFFPQVYEIIWFKPFVSKDEMLQVPVGIGCRRNQDLSSLIDVPTVPDFSNKNLMTFGEVSYVSASDVDSAWNYYSTFMFAMDINTDHMSYMYTPWGGTKDGKDTPNGFIHITYDMKNKYVYSYNLVTDECMISRIKSYTPRYFLPRNGGYIDLNDPMVLFPNNEFQYMADGKDRGLDVHIFEAVMKDYPLGNRSVSKVIVNHNYLKDTEVIDNVVEVRNTTLSAQFKFYADPKKPYTEKLTINFYGFTTEIQRRRFVFSVANCMKNDDDYLWVNIGFPADAKLMDKIKTEVPSIRQNVLNSIMLASELNALRIPTILVDFADMIYVTLTILDKPPLELDFLDPEEDKTISDTSEVEGIISFDGCANKCLQSETSCWGFAYCGATCYIGTSNKATVTAKSGCKLYRRFDNNTYIPSKESAAEGLRQLVDGRQLKIAVPAISDIPNDAPEFLEATYFSYTSPSEPEDIFGLMGKQTNPRLRVVKPGYKLVKTGKAIKNFGSLRYDECQRLCLDYRRCETVSYCLKDSECVLSMMYGEDIPKENMIEDSLCNLLTRKYADHFDRSPGDVLSTTAAKTVKLNAPEDCARACVKENSFDCLSFDFCPDAEKDACRLHTIHLLDVKNKESTVSKQASCGHYSKKFSYDYKRDENKKTVGLGFIAATNITMEQCAKVCNEYSDGNCFGYDFCADKSLTSTTCSILTSDPTPYKTTYSAICNHFVRNSVAMSPSSKVPASKVAWVGVVCFFVAAIVGVLATFGFAYYKANRSS